MCPSKIAVVIPAYNEEKTIEQVVCSVIDLHGLGGYEVKPFVVNDASTDRTAEVLGRLHQRLIFSQINLSVNLGIGGAVQTGFRAAVDWGADVVVQLDGDGQHPAMAIPRLLRALRLADPSVGVVIGSRYCRGGGGLVSSRTRRLGTAWFSLLVRLLAGVRIADVTSGFRAFERRAALMVAARYPDDFPEVQAYVMLARAGIRFKEIPVNMAPRREGKSSIKMLGAVRYMAQVTMATAIERLRPRQLK
jgi:glycosyltransferase involved in cell wall biosynthesis